MVGLCFWISKGAFILKSKIKVEYCNQLCECILVVGIFGRL